MRVSEKLALINKIARELQSRFTFDEIDMFLAEFGVVQPQGDVAYNSKWVYSKAALKGVADAVVLKIAEELDMPVAGASGLIEPPRNWQGAKALRLFISHISVEKVKATRLKECLAPYKIAGFVAHEDIHPTLEWQIEIERALHTMDAFVAMHTKGFSQSIWTQQEIGFAVAKGVKIISLKMGEDPTGFISKQQALPRGNKTAEEIAKEIDRLLTEDPRTRERLVEAKGPKNPFETSDADIPF